MLIAGLPSVVEVAAGSAHSLALTDTGQVFAFGLGSSGQLGQGTTASSSVPVAVSGLPTVVAIAAGANHSLAVTAAGEVWAWGDNGSNQVAPGATTDRLVPTPVAQVTDAVAVAAGSSAFAGPTPRRQRLGVGQWGDGQDSDSGINQPADAGASARRKSGDRGVGH